MKTPVAGLLLAALILGACRQGTPVPTPTPTAAAQLAPAETTEVVPAFATRLAQFEAVLQADPPVLLLDGLDDAQQAAQTLALRSPDFQRYWRDPASGAALRTEIIRVDPARESDLTDATAACQTGQCFRVELYNYAYNLTTVAIADVSAQAVWAVTHYPDTQPDLNPRLTELAVAIARDTFNQPGMARSLGFTPDQATAVMASIKTALNGTRCERSRHLCAAPTFLAGGHALWTIVDLTDGVMVGVRWTELGASSGVPITEQGLQNEVVTARYCERTTPLERDGWQLDYMLTSSDGLRLSAVRFGGRPVLESAKLVDWHVSYSQSDGFGYSDAIGCPIFSAAAVVAFNGPQVLEIPGGFALVQDFRSEVWPLPCNYRYEQRFEFYQDGRFRVVVGNLGRGCGTDGVYRPVVRLHWAKADWHWSEWNGAEWRPWPAEGWQLQTSETEYTPEGYQYRLTDGVGRGYFVTPGQGQFGDGGRGDNAYVYITAHAAGRDEGDSDMLTVGPCCNVDYHQGPEKFIEPAPEALTSGDLVLWYVPQMENDEVPGQEYCWADAVLEAGVYVPRVWPCYAGPLFTPLGGP
ncbi:MAG: hypothetical protein JNK29_09050 [Anaerolineales bacterium]|nr:hypothetical protein [Anaerolineales bacterium]